MRFDDDHKMIALKALTSGLNVWKGPLGDGLGIVMDIMEKRKRTRVSRFATALLKISHQESETRDVCYDENLQIAFSDLLQACMDDSDLEKTENYAWLTAAIRGQLIDHRERRHFIKALKSVTSEDLLLLQQLYIISKNKVMLEGIDRPAQQLDICTPEKLGPVGKLSIDQFRLLGLYGEKKLTALGERFVQATHHRDELIPDAVGWQTWRKETICLIADSKVTKRRVELVRALRGQRFTTSIVMAKDFPHKHEDILTHKFFLFFEPFANLTYSYEQRIKGFIDEHTYGCICIKPGAGLDGIPYKNIIESDYTKAANYIAAELGYQLSESIYAEP